MRGLFEITAAILAGGLGTRLRPVVSDRPKVLAEVHGRPFMAYLLDQLVSAGIRYVVLCTGYQGEQVRAMFGNHYRDLDLAYSQEPEPLGTAGALRLALPLFQSDPVLAMNGDSFCETDLESLWAWHRARNASATLLLTEVRNERRYGKVVVDASGQVMHFTEKNDKDLRGWINAGLYLIHRHLLLTIPADRPVSLEKEMFPTWVGKGLYGYFNRGIFLDIGTPEAYASAQQIFAQRGKDGPAAFCSNGS